MKAFLLYFQLLWLPLFLVNSDANKTISLHVDKLPFSSLVERIEEKADIKIYYQELWVKELIVTIHEDEILPIDALRIALKGTRITVSEWGGNLVLLPSAKLITNLPSYQTKKKEFIAETANSIETKDESSAYLKGRKADLQVITLGKREQASGAQSVTLSGTIKEAISGESIPGATVYIEETKRGAAADAEGRFTLQIKPGKYTARFNFLGMEEKKFHLNIYSSGSFKVEMNQANFEMDEVVIYGDKQMNIRAKDPGLEKIAVKSIREIPMMMGEPDILKVAEMLPGIVSVGEGSTGLNVRGGNADQNAFYINNIPIYNTAHLFGFFPAFNAEIIKDFSIYKGYIPASYGGRLSSVFDITTKTGNKKVYTAHGGISPVSANLVFEGPIKKDKASFLLSGRKSYSDWLLAKINDATISASSAKFSDFSASLNYDTPKSQLGLFTYYSNDYFRLADLNTYSYFNMGGALNYGHNFSEKKRLNISVVGSIYGFSTIDTQFESTAYEHSYQISDYETRIEMEQRLNDKHDIQYGATLIYYNLDRGSVDPYGGYSLKIQTDLGQEQALEGAVYFTDNYKINSRLSTNVGVRFGAFAPMGEKTVYTYLDNFPKEDRYITDSIQFAAGEIIKWYFAPDIRAALNYETDPNGNLKFSYNRTHQNIFMLNNTIAIAPNTQWKLADYYLKPAQSQQISAGVFRTIPKGDWETSLEVFYKKTNYATEFRDGAEFIDNPNVEQSVLQGDQNAYGFEFLIKRSGHKLNGWLAYTFSRAMVKVANENSWDQINQGEAYPANFDIPHVVNAMLNYKIRKRISVSATLTYQSGKPVTYPIATYTLEELNFIDYSSRNEYRIPHYFRTDISLKIEGNLRKDKLIHSSFLFSIYNLTGRDNPYSVYFDQVNGKLWSYQYSIIGVPLFTATWLFKLGNYAAE